MNEVEKMIVDTDNRSRSNTKRLDNLEKKVEDIHELTLAISQVNDEVKNIKGDVEEIKVEVKNVAARPGKWWDKLIAAALGALASGIVAAVLANVLH